MKIEKVKCLLLKSESERSCFPEWNRANKFEISKGQLERTRSSDDSGNNTVKLPNQLFVFGSISKQNIFLIFGNLYTAKMC